MMNRFIVDNFLFSLNAILPVFIMVFLGFALKKKGFLDEGFFNTADKFIFNLALPCNLFVGVIKGDVDKLKASFPLILYSAVGILVFFLLLCLTVPFFIKDNGRRGAFIQGSYRGNFAILGLPLAENLFGDAGTITVAVLMPVTIVAFNVLAVSVLSACAPIEVKRTPVQTVTDILKSIAKNPLIIGTLAGLLVLLLGVKLPNFAVKTATKLSDTVFALALMSLGAGFSFEALKGRIWKSATAALIKTVMFPMLMVTMAVMLGFRGVELGILLILSGAPTAVSSYIMAKNMKSDYEMAGQILLISTLLCMFTLFFGVFVLKTMRFI